MHIVPADVNSALQGRASSLLVGSRDLSRSAATPSLASWLQLFLSDLAVDLAASAVSIWSGLSAPPLVILGHSLFTTSTRTCISQP